MAYRNDFYNVRNIIGYTGDLRFLPTVYFQRGHEYGHITQHHHLSFNVGREKVCFHFGYRIVNHEIEGRTHAVEWEGDQAVHMSRNPFVKRQHLGPGDLLTLSEAVFRCPDLKLCDDHPGVRDVANAKHQVHRELLQQFRAQRKHRMQNELLLQFHMVRVHRLDLFMPGVDRNPRATHVIDTVLRHNR